MAPADQLEDRIFNVLTNINHQISRRFIPRAECLTFEFMLREGSIFYKSRITIIMEKQKTLWKNKNRSYAQDRSESSS